MLDFSNYQFCEGLTHFITEEDLKWYDKVKVGDIVYYLDMYKPNSKISYQSEIVFFIADKQIDITDLSAYKEATKASSLIAITTSDEPLACLALADSIIYCQPDEIENVLSIFESLIVGGTGILFNTDIGHIESNLAKQKAYFVSCSVDDCQQIHILEQTLKNAIQQHQLALPLSTICVSVISNFNQLQIADTEEYIQYLCDSRLLLEENLLYNFKHVEDLNGIKMDMLLVDNIFSEK